ncbi:MAG: hypothetical protein ABR603_12040, partial [Pyrinomonadaceae bacterium]
MMTTKPTEVSLRRRGERGAALVTSLLVAMLLLAAGGALIASAGMTAANAVDATSEAQAYYAADAGLQAALNVLRRNVPSDPAGTDADFHRLACGTADPCTNAGYNLALWLDYDGDTVEISSNPSLGYRVEVYDPSRPRTATLGAAYQPRYLVVRSTGRELQKGATKVLEMMVDRFQFSYDAPAPLVLRESEDGTNHVSIDPGPGAPNSYSGTDASNPLVTKPAVGVGQTLYNGNSDLVIATTAMAGEVLTGGVMPVGTAAMPWPDIVSDAETTAAAVASMREFASSTACPPNNQALSGYTFIDGDCSLGPQNSGSGFMVITG